MPENILTEIVNARQRQVEQLKITRPCPRSRPWQAGISWGWDRVLFVMP